MAVVTLGGLTGGGGRLLGPNVAGRLGADYVDRLILADAARRIGATVEALHQREERPFSRGERFMGLLQRILERSAVAGIGTDPYFGAGALSGFMGTLTSVGAAPMEAACSKYFCSEMAGRVADRCLQIHGGAGYMAEYDIERLYRDIRLLRIYEGTSQIQQLVIARRTLAQRAA